MPSPSYLTIIENLFSQLDVLLNAYIFHAYTALAHYLQYPLSLAMILYITLLGLAITQGFVQLSMAHLIKSALTLALVYTAAMHWGWFSYFVVNTITQGCGEMGDVLVNATPTPLPHFAGPGINGALQSVLIEFTEIGAWVWDKGTWHNFSPCVTALLIWGFGYAMLLVAVFELVLAKLMLAILFSTAPLFVAFTLFKPTHAFFDRWLGACVGFGFLMIFISSILALILSLAQWVISFTYATHAVGVTLVSFVPIMIVGFMGIGIMLKASHLAQSLGGVVTVSAGSSLLAGTIGGVVGRPLTMLRTPIAPVETLHATGTSGKTDTGVGKSVMNGIRHSLSKVGR